MIAKLRKQKTNRPTSAWALVSKSGRIQPKTISGVEATAWSTARDWMTEHLPWAGDPGNFDWRYDPDTADALFWEEANRRGWRVAGVEVQLQEAS